MSATPSAAPMTVAVIDDDKNVRVGMGNLMRAIGLDVALFEAPGSFLEQDFTRFSCVLSDMQMPGMSGLEFQRRLAQVAPTLPIIFITGYPDASVRDAAFAAGAKGFFEKPCDIEELVAALEALLGN